jgi:hypothetical protein
MSIMYIFEFSNSFTIVEHFKLEVLDPQEVSREQRSMSLDDIISKDSQDDVIKYVKENMGAPLFDKICADDYLRYDLNGPMALLPELGEILHKKLNAKNLLNANAGECVYYASKCAMKVVNDRRDITLSHQSQSLDILGYQECHYELGKKGLQSFYTNVARRYPMQGARAFSKGSAFKDLIHSEAISKPFDIENGRVIEEFDILRIESFVHTSGFMRTERQEDVPTWIMIIPGIGSQVYPIPLEHERLYRQI